MNPNRENVLVLGANGKVGKHLVKHLIKQYHVVALIRGAPKYGINSNHLEYAQGDVFDQGVLAPLVKNAKIVVSCLKPEAPHSVEEYTKRLIETVKSNGSPRLIVVGNLGSLLDKTGDKKIQEGKAFPQSLKQASQHHTNALKELRNSDLDFIAVCPPSIVEGNDDDKYAVFSEVATEPVKYQLKGGNLGSFVLKQAKNPTYTKQAVGLWDQ